MTTERKVQEPPATRPVTAGLSEAELPILKPGRNCWRIVRAERVTPLIDIEDYFRAAREAMLNATRSIMLLGWSFHPGTELVRGGGEARFPSRIGDVLNFVAERNPELDVRVLIWRMPLPYAMRNDFYPQRGVKWFKDSGVKYRLDPCKHTGASHHQKLLVIDDAVAFCGGGDFVIGRWDTSEHKDGDPRRRDPSGYPYPARHEVMTAVAGPAAAALGDIARERWLLATGERLAPPHPGRVEAAWPHSCGVELTDVPLAISRTSAAFEDEEAVRENEALLFDSIAAARKLILLENQYFTAPGIGAALAARLGERDGPEIVIISTHRSPGFLDGLCMDAARDKLISRLREVDRYNRFHIYNPRTPGGDGIIVHSKVSVIDDGFLRIGSCNIANRSMGFDTECDVTLSFPETQPGEKGREAVCRFRNRLVGHYLGATAEQVGDALEQMGSLSGAIEMLDGHPSRRLPPLEPRRLGPVGRLVAHYHLGDPEGAADAWMPWRRHSLRDSFEETLSRRKSTTKGR